MEWNYKILVTILCDRFDREMFYKLRMAEQRAELDELVDERKKLLAIQEQLQKLHDQLPGVCLDELTSYSLVCRNF